MIFLAFQFGCAVINSRGGPYDTKRFTSVRPSCIHSPTCRKLNFARVGIEYTDGHLYTCVQGSPVGIPTQNTLELDVLQQGRPAVCVIAQQYSSTAFASLRPHSRKVVLGTRLKKYVLGF